MIQTILVGVVFIAAIIIFGRFIYRQINAGDEENGHCDKCLPKQSSNIVKEKN